MSILNFIEGAVAGFSIAAPIGPIGILCVRRTLERGAREGLAIGICAASCDMAVAMVAAFGITLVSDFIALEQYRIRVVGGIILLAIGYLAFRGRPLAEKPAKPPRDRTLTCFSIALLAFTNPLALFAYAAAFAMIGVGNIVGHPASGIALVAGVFTGSLSWFVLLIGLVRLVKDKVLRVGIGLVNRVAGSLLMLCGLIALWSGIRGL